MAKMIDELWPVFLAEVTEQLDLLELQLVKVDDLEQVDIDQFFRLFHTIKSSCAMLDFKHMEEVAHTSEDLLDLARKGTIQLTTKIIDVLLEAVDALKEQLQEAEKLQASPGPRKSVVAMLKEHIVSITSPGARKIQLANDEPVFNVVKEEFDQLEVLVKSSLDKALFHFQTGKKSEQKSHLIKLRNFFDLMGVAVIKNLIREAITLTDSEAGFDVLHNADLVAAILEKIEYLEKASSRDLSVSSTRKIAFNQYSAYLENLLHDIAPEVLRVLGDLSPSVTDKFPEQLSSRIQQARSLLRMMGYRSIALLLGHIYQALKIKFYEKEANPLNIESVNSTVHFLKEFEFVRFNEDDLKFVNNLIGDKTGSDVSMDNVPVNEAEISSTITSQLINTALWKKYLSQADAEKINDLYNKGCFIFEIYADLESNTEFATRFIDWLYENTVVITNVHVDAESLRRLSVNAGLAFLCYSDNRENADKMIEKLNDASGFLQYCCIQLNARQKGETGSATDDNAAADTSTSSTLRIDSKTLDRFVSQVGEMVTRRNMLTYVINDQALLASLKQLEELAQHLANQLPAEAEKIQQVTSQLSKVHHRLLNADASVQQVSNRIQEEVMGLRVVPIAMVFNRLPKMVRRLSRELNKNVSLQLSGESVKIDKGLVDLLMEPMSHIVRNAIDHGIEGEEERANKNKPRGGMLRINAINKGSTLRIEISDDGRGLPKGKILAKAHVRGIDISETATDEEIFNLIFLPGFSTSEVITEISGRGVGMDAVKERIRQLGGRIIVTSTENVGTQFVFELPLSVAIQGVVVVESYSQKYAIPERNVAEILDVKATDIQSVNNQSAYMLRGNILPLYDLDTLLYFENTMSGDKALISVVVVSNGESQIGIAVKAIAGRHEIYVKDVNHQLLNLPGFGGASILGDGSVVIILDGDKLISLAEKNPQPASLFLKAC